MIETVSLIFLGWLLGILSPVIIDKNRRARSIRELKPLLKAELKELQYTLTMVSYDIHMHHSTVDRPYLQWLKSILDKCEGLENSDVIKEFVEHQLTLSDDQINAISNHTNYTGGVSLTLRKHSVSFLESKLIDLS